MHSCYHKAAMPHLFLPTCPFPTDHPKTNTHFHHCSPRTCCYKSDHHFCAINHTHLHYHSAMPQPPFYPTFPSHNQPISTLFHPTSTSLNTHIQPHYLQLLPPTLQPKPYTLTPQQHLPHLDISQPILSPLSNTFPTLTSHTQSLHITQTNTNPPKLCRCYCCKFWADMCWNTTITCNNPTYTPLCSPHIYFPHFLTNNHCINLCVNMLMHVNSLGLPILTNPLIHPLCYPHTYFLHFHTHNPSPPTIYISSVTYSPPFSPTHKTTTRQVNLV